jgi:hypothetical protein
MRRALVLTGLLAALPLPAAAQSWQRVGLDTTASIDHFNNDATATRPQVIVDVTASIRLGNGWQAYVRPWFRLPRKPDWDRQIYQAALQYQRPGSIAMRVDLGYFASPMGLGMLDTSPVVNPMIGPHLSYFVPLMPFNSGGPRVRAVAASYPLGAQLSLSGRWWDARGALVSSSPSRIVVIGGADKPKATPVVDAGGGVTIRPGFRIGGSFSRGAYATRDELTAPSSSSRMLTLGGVEGEYAFRYTKISGEWLRSRFETATSTAGASTWFIQGTQSLSARWFVAARREAVSAPAVGTSPFFARQPDLNSAEATVGYRLTPEVTLRTGWAASQFYGSPVWVHHAGVSAVWNWRWR